MRSLNLVEGEGFKLLAQKLVDIRAKYGSQAVENILPTSHTISNRLPKKYDILKQKLFDITKNIRGIGVTLDLWKHNTGAHYITITGHYIKSDSIDKIWKIENCVLATREMRQRQTRFNIKEMIDVVLDEFGFTNDNNYFVTNSARNTITAFDDKEKYSCSGQNINLALKQTFNNEMIKS
jgi:hypothetical protein